MLKERRIETYDFRRPNKLNREHIRALQIVGETWARQFTTILSTSLRTVCQISMEDVTQQTYDEYILGLSNPTMLNVIELHPLDGSSMLNIPIDIAMSVVDRILGGSGSGTHPNRGPTEIEMRLLRGVLERALDELSYALESLVPIRATINRTETNPQFAQVTAPTDMIIVVEFTMRVGEAHGVLSLGLPFNTMSPALDEAGPNKHEENVHAHKIQSALEHAVGGAALEIRVRFDELELPSKAIADLTVGDVLPLGHPVDEPVTVEVAGLPRFLATVGTRGKRVACLVTDTLIEV